MTPELGHLALILAFVFAVAQTIVPLLGRVTGKESLLAFGPSMAVGQCLFILLSFVILEYAFWHNDFTVAYVAQQSNTALPWQYRLSALWGGHEGSLLLWVLMLSGWGLMVVAKTKSLPVEMRSTIIMVMGAVAVGFLSFILETSNPFTRILPNPPAEGAELNPLLQDIGLILHPPILYMGYVGFAVAFAFGIAALVEGKLDSAWARWTRPWTLAAWCFLTLGIALGSFWAYYELGWGGWWFWDPVENASFMPWLIGTALIHSLIITEKRGLFKSWTVLLALLAFALSLLGTFLVRSGVLTSVHAFANDPERGVFILGFLAVVVCSAFGLYAWRAPQLKSDANFTWVSRESFLLFNNAILLVAAATVLLGTLYPLIIDAMGLGKLSVGPPYFNAVFLPLMVLLAGLLGLGVLSRWKGMPLRELILRARLPFILSLIFMGLLSYLLLNPLYVWGILGIALMLWVGLATLQDMGTRHGSSQGNHWFKTASKRPQQYWGMVFAHLGFAVVIIGVTMVSLYDSETDIRIAPGGKTDVAGYEITFESLQAVKGPNYDAAEGLFHVEKAGDSFSLRPQKRFYHAHSNTMTEADIRGGLFEDFYISLGEPLSGKDWAVRIYHKPFVRCIWLGAILMAVGALVSLLSKGFRSNKRAEV